jgi:hypothetical protein
MRLEAAMRRMCRWLVLPLVVAGASVSGCQEESCTEEAVAGAVVTVVDANEDRICDAVVQVVGEGKQETLEPSGGDGKCTYAGLYETAGVFDLDVFKGGYRRVLLADSLRIGLDETGCHVVTEKKTVELEAE